MKNKRYWLRGIGIALVIFLTLLSLFFLLDHRQGDFWDWLVLASMMPFAFATAFNAQYMFTGILLQGLLYGVSGALLGFIYSKLK